MINLLSETKEAIRESKHTIDDILWIGSADGNLAISWDDFEKIADIDYDSGYGAQKIATDLVIVLKDKTWLERGEYDGSEWWDYRGEAPIRKRNSKKFNKVKTNGVGWDDLSEINNI